MSGWTPSDGLLPKWMLFISAVSIFNTIQTYSTQSLTAKIYSNSRVTPLQTRTFGIWTLTSAIVRLYAAYNIHNPQIYQLAIGTYIIALAHFSSEFAIFRTVKIGPGFLSPFIVASITILI